MKDTFSERTAILPILIAETVLARREHSLSSKQIQWFIAYCDQRIRTLYQANQNWKRKLNSRSNAGRDLCYTFINHWLDSYLKSGERIAV